MKNLLLVAVGFVVTTYIFPYITHRIAAVSTDTGSTTVKEVVTQINTQSGHVGMFVPDGASETAVLPSSGGVLQETGAEKCSGSTCSGRMDANTDMVHFLVNRPGASYMAEMEIQ